jgi:hypothetical protein
VSITVGENVGENVFDAVGVLSEIFVGSAVGDDVG